MLVGSTRDHVVPRRKRPRKKAAPPPQKAAPQRRAPKRAAPKAKKVDATFGTDPATETYGLENLGESQPMPLSIPVRLFLSNINLTPTMRNVNNLFSVRYYLNLVLVDEEDRRYFKQQEITLYRAAE